MGNARLERGHRLFEVQSAPCHSRDDKEFPRSLLVRTPRFLYGVQSLVGEQRSCKPHTVTKKRKKGRKGESKKMSQPREAYRNHN